MGKYLANNSVAEFNEMKKSHKCVLGHLLCIC